MSKVHTDSSPKPADMKRLHRVLNPRSIAMVGISRNPESFGYPLVQIALQNGYAGTIHLINPRADIILGLKCYPQIADVPVEVDLAVLMVSKHLLSDAVRQCVDKRVGGIVIITAAFPEGDGNGASPQEELVALAASKGIPIIGPNTLGFYSGPSNLDALMCNFIPKGRVALISQSGNLTISLTFPGGERGLGFSYIVDIGNAAGLQAHDLVRFLRDDPDTDMIVVHVEGFREGRTFIEEVRRTVTQKPVLVLKSGRTEAGAKVVASHTASIAGSDDIYAAALRQAGAIQVDNFVSLHSALLAFKHGKRVGGNRVCIISEGGGDCAVTADASVRAGLEIPELSAESQERLRAFVPEHGAVRNPIDMAGWQNKVKAAEIALADPSIDGVLVVGSFAGFDHVDPSSFPKVEQYVDEMCALAATSTKPVLIYSSFAYRNGPLHRRLREHNVPLFLDHHDAAGAMAMLVRQEAIRKRMEGRDFQANLPDQDAQAAEAGAKGMLEPDAKQLLARYGFTFPRESLATTAEEAVSAADAIGYPVVLKIVSPDISHKTDAGGVMLGLNTPDQVREAFEEVRRRAHTFNPRAEIKGALICGMETRDGVEVILGGLRDPVFGPVVMFGIGGVFVEILKDVSFRVCPIGPADAAEMLDEIRGRAMLGGARGKAPADTASLTEALVALSRLLIENPQIAEIDLNPVKALPQGISVLDARIVLR